MQKGEVLGSAGLVGSGRFPLATGRLAKRGSPLTAIAAKLGAQPAQVALAWLLKKSPVVLPIPGTSKVNHLESNTAAALLDLDDWLRFAAGDREVTRGMLRDSDP